MSKGKKFFEKLFASRIILAAALFPHGHAKFRLYLYPASLRRASVSLFSGRFPSVGPALLALTIKSIFCIWPIIMITEILQTTHGEGLVDITAAVRQQMQVLIPIPDADGVLFLYCPHTSCALTINEGFDPSAQRDLEKFWQHLAPRNLALITHKAEGSDDSPSHMKASLLQSSLHFLVEKGHLILGRWQSIYLAEFRDGPKERKIYLKFIPENHP